MAPHVDIDRRLAELSDEYIHLVNERVTEDREDLIAGLSAQYMTDALAILITA
jgi:hypothetical protein